MPRNIAAASCIAALAAFAAALPGPAARAATFTWNGASTTSDNFTDGANWVGGTAPTSGGILQFGTVAAGGNTTAADNAGNSLNPNYVYFLGSSDTGGPAPAMTINAGSGTTSLQLVFGNSNDVLHNNSSATQTFNIQVALFNYNNTIPGGVNNVGANGGDIVLNGGVNFRTDADGGHAPAMQSLGSHNLDVSGVISGTGSVIANNSGSGMLNLGGANTYTNGTIVAGGTLLLSNTSGSATGTGAVQLQGGTLAGTGSGSGTFTATTSNITIAPGNGGTAGTLTLGALDLNGKSGENFVYDLGTNSSMLDVSSALSLATGEKVNINAGSGFGTGVYHLMSYGTIANAGDLSSWTISGPSGFDYALTDNTAGNTIDLSVSTVPEPATLALIGGGMVAAVGLRRRRSARRS